MSLPLRSRQRGGALRAVTVPEGEEGMVVAHADTSWHARQPDSALEVWRWVVVLSLLATLGVVLWGAIQTQRTFDRL